MEQEQHTNNSNNTEPTELDIINFERELKGLERFNETVLDENSPDHQQYLVAQQELIEEQDKYLKENIFASLFTTYFNFGTNRCRAFKICNLTKA